MLRGNSNIDGILSFVSLLACLVASMSCQAGETIRIGGTGSALAAMRILGAELQKRDSGIHVEVLASLGTLGGIEALAEGAIDIGLAARGLKPEELAKGVREAACMTTALIFAANHQDQGYGIRTAGPFPGPKTDLGGRHAAEAHPQGTIRLRVSLSHQSGARNERSPG
jgi:phosphate transport system substrate-binding protein